MTNMNKQKAIQLQKYARGNVLLLHKLEQKTVQ